MGRTFGDTTLARSYVPAGGASSTRGVFGGGVNSGFSQINNIEYITIASTGNGTDFGYLSHPVENLTACSNGTKTSFCGGYISGATSTVNQVTIATTGNSSNFGDLSAGRTELAAASNCHGGI